MNLGRCPVCHARLGLEEMCQDEAGRELLGLLADLPAETGRALVSYLGLFRPPKRDLANDRALRLARETLEVCPDYLLLAEALRQTVEAIRAKGGPPLKNHNYLKRVAETAQARPHAGALARREDGDGQSGPRTKTGQAISRLLSGA